MKKLSSLLLLLLPFAAPAFASVTVSSPSNGTDVSSPFTLTADASTCSSQPVVVIAYSLDGGSDLATVNATSIQESVSAGTGAHTVHVKAWGNQGTVCVTDVAVTVTGSSSGGGGGSSLVPSGVTSVSSMQTLTDWKATHDAGTPGGSSGSMSIASSPSRSGAARRFVTHYSDYGGERYSFDFGDDTSATNFVYDTWVYIQGSASNIGNLEMDMNQVMSNGWTVIYGFQCDGYSGTWDYTANTGSPTHPSDHWEHSSAPCNPRSWSPNTWHHVQIAYSRNSSGVVTYKSVTFDGTEHTLNVTVLSAFALGWGPNLSSNFQVDGIGGGGTNTIYLDNMTISRW